MTGRTLLYGATGYTGRLLAAHRQEYGTGLVLAGRDAAGLTRLGGALGLPIRAFELTEDFDAALADIAVVVHAAGPFQQTASPMMAACIRTRTHYLDVAGEWPVFQDAMDRSLAATANGVMLLPGAGFSIVASDCLLALAAGQLKDVQVLRLATSRPAMMARGSVVSANGLTSPTVLVRRDGRLCAEPVGQSVRYFDFGDGPSRAAAVTWPDVLTGAFTTGIPTIETYSETGFLDRLTYRACSAAAPWIGSSAGQTVARVLSRAWTAAPTEAARENAGFVLVAEATDRWKRTATLRLRTKDGYTVTVLAVAEILRRVLDGAAEPGFRTPAGLFGGGFIQSLGCATLEALPV